MVFTIGSETTSVLILPENPLFDWTLATAPPPGSQGVNFLVADSESGILRPATNSELQDYLYGGEYDDRMRAIGDSADPEESYWLWLQSLGGPDALEQLGDCDPE